MRTDRFLSVAYFVAWCVAFAFLCSRHVPWRDEYQSWLVSIHTHSVGEFFTAIRYERAPFMQYVLSRAVFECASLLQHFFPEIEPWRIEWSRGLSAAFSVASVAMIVCGFPRQPRWLRFGVPLGILFVLEYGMISRGYPMGIFFWLLAARRRTLGDRAGYWIWMTVAASFHLFFTLMSGAFLAIDAFEERKSIRAFLPTAILCAVCLASIFLFQIPPADSGFPSAIRWEGLGLGRLISPLASGLTGWESPSRHFQWDAQSWKPGAGLLAACPLFLLAKKARFPLLHFLIVVGLPLLILTNTYGAGMRHAGLFFVVALILVLGNPERIAAWVLAPNVALMFLASVRFITAWNPLNPAFDFSGSRELEAKIGKELAEPSAILVAEPGPIFIPVASDLNLILIDAPFDRVLTYPSFRISSSITFAAWCSEHLPARLAEGKTVYLGFHRGISPPPECGKVDKVFENTRVSAAGESYAVFRVM